MEKAELRWLGQMGLLIRIGDMTFCIDYFASETPGRQVRPPIPAEKLRGVDVFLGTHNHLDHIDHEAWKIWAKTNPRALFVFPEAHRESLLADGIDPSMLRGMNDRKTLRVGEAAIHAVAAAHEFLDRDERTGLYPCLQYVIEWKGIRIYHAGDTLRYEGMLTRLKELGPFSAAMLPINGRDGSRYRRNCIGNMTFQEAADLAGEIRPGIVLPGHWDMFADNPGDPEAFADYLDAKYGGAVQCVIPKILAPVICTSP